MTKAVVLLSGGVDSATCLGIAINDLGSENVSTVSITYGQKHAKEIRCARSLANFYQVPHYVLDLSEVFKYSDCPLLVQSNKEVPDGAYADQIDRADNGMVSTYVPFRNGLMLSAASSFAMSIYPDSDIQIYIGAHADDAAGNAYADCSEEFTIAMARAISYGTYNKVRLHAPLVEMNKSQVVATGLKLGVPYELTWSCYKGGDKACGTCGTCIDRLKAFADNDAVDPIEYEVQR